MTSRDGINLNPLCLLALLLVVQTIGVHGERLSGSARHSPQDQAASYETVPPLASQVQGPPE